MPIATFRFYEELNDFLPNNRKKVDFEAKLNGKKSIKEIIEELGVPPEAVDLILVNGKSVVFNYVIKVGDRVSVYPVFERLNIQNVTQLRLVPLRRIQFIADSHLKKIVNPMRMLGFNIDFNESYHGRPPVHSREPDTLAGIRRTRQHQTRACTMYTRRLDRERLRGDPLPDRSLPG